MFNGFLLTDIPCISSDEICYDILRSWMSLPRRTEFCAKCFGQVTTSGFEKSVCLLESLILSMQQFSSLFVWEEGGGLTYFVLKVLQLHGRGRESEPARWLAIDHQLQQKNKWTARASGVLEAAYPSSGELRSRVSKKYDQCCGLVLRMLNGVREV
jgi:hypothetical protein